MNQVFFGVCEGVLLLGRLLLGRLLLGRLSDYDEIFPFHIGGLWRGMLFLRWIRQVLGNDFRLHRFQWIGFHSGYWAFACSVVSALLGWHVDGQPLRGLRAMSRLLASSVFS